MTSRFLLTAAFATAALYPFAARAQAPPALVYGTDTDRYDGFGSDAALVGDRLVVGAPGADLGLLCETCQPGAAYVFEPGGAAPWVQTARISPFQSPADAPSYGNFGSEVDACEAVGPDGPVTYLAAGAPGESFGFAATGSPPPDSLYNGAVYVYRQPAGGAWAFERKFRDLAPRQRGYFGSGVSLVCEGAGVTVLAAGDSRTSQLVTWHRDGGSGAWSAGQSGGPASISAGDFYSIEASAGGPSGAPPAMLDGRVVFRRTRGPEAPWARETTLPEPVLPNPNNYMFWYGAIEGDWIVTSYAQIIEPRTDNRVYVYRYGGPGAGWVQDAVLRRTPAARNFGQGTQIVAMPDDTVLVGVLTWRLGGPTVSAVTLFRRDGSGIWTEVAAIPSLPPAPGRFAT